FRSFMGRGQATVVAGQNEFRTKRIRESKAMTNITLLPAEGLFIGRARTSDVSHPLVVTVRDGTVFDITSSAAPTVRDICEMADPAGYARSAKGKSIGALEAIAANSFQATRDPAKAYLLSPVDLQAVKASGVTF